MPPKARRAAARASAGSSPRASASRSASSRCACDLVVELAIEPVCRDERKHAGEQPAQRHALAPRMRRPARVGLLPVGDFDVQLLGAGPGQGIELHLAVGLGDAPLGGDPALLLEAHQGRIDRALAEAHDALGHLLDAPGDAVAVQRPQGVERLEDQQVQGAVRQFSFIVSTCRLSTYIPQSGCQGCLRCQGCQRCGAYGAKGCQGCQGCRGCRGCQGCQGCRGCQGCQGSARFRDFAVTASLDRGPRRA